MATIDAGELTLHAPIRNLNDLLTAHAAGVQVVSGVQSGAGMRVQIRGARSLLLSAEPWYLIDGIRMTSAAGRSAFVPETGGSRPSRTGDVSPEEIERIEIVRGPSATALYGTDAANGVVLITTRRGAAGAPRWTVFGEGGRIGDPGRYPTAYTAEGHAFNDPVTRLSGPACQLDRVASTAPTRCVIDSVRAYSIFADPDATVLDIGRRYRTGMQLSGGSPRLRYFVAADRESETSPVTLPPFELARLASSGTAVPDHQRNPNAFGRNSIRANVDASIGSTLDVGVSTGFIDLDNRFYRELGGLGFNIFAGPGFPDNGNSAGGGPPLPGGGPPLHGYAIQPPGVLFQVFRGQTVRRFILSANATWRPLPWLTNRVNVGTDVARDIDLLSDDQPRFSPPLGFRDESGSTHRTFTADVSSSVLFSLRPNLTSRTTLGAQRLNFRYDLHRVSGFVGGLIASGEEQTIITKTTGLFAEEELGFSDRLFVSAALRSDEASIYGPNSGRVLNPRVGVSWVPSAKSVFSKVPALGELRLRAAYGVSGMGSGVDAITDDVHPERSSELEGGFDARFLGNRAFVDLTLYRKRTQDLIVDAPRPPSLGTPTIVVRNAGTVRNTGVEMTLGARLVQNSSVGLDVAVTGSTNRNRLLDLGNVPPIIGFFTRAQPGYPLFGYWERPLLGYADKNGDGLIAFNADPGLSELTVGDTAVFIGNAQPTRTLTVAPGVDLFDKRVRITSLLDYRGGNYLLNDTELIRCTFSTCAGRQNPTSPLFEQARAVALLDHPARTRAGYIEPASFTRWRELAVTLDVPERLASRYLRARSASITLSGRNLHVWTDYTGVDPEADSFASAGGTGVSAAPQEILSLAPPRYYSMRVNLVF